MYYSKLPPKVASLDSILVVDPMLATGGSVLMAIKVRNLVLPDAGKARSKAFMFWGY